MTVLFSILRDLSARVCYFKILFIFAQSILMKKIFLLTSAIILETTLFAQDTLQSVEKPIKIRDYKRHEINVGFLNLFNRLSFMDYVFYYNSYSNNNIEYNQFSSFYRENIFLSQYGVGYKFHFKQSAIRSIFDIGVKNDKTSYESMGTASQTTNDYSLDYQTIGFRLGYEFLMGTRTQFYFGADLIGQMSNSKYSYKLMRIPLTQGGQTTWNEYESKGTYYGYGAGTIMGVKFHINDMISLTTETRFDFIAFNQKSSGSRSDYDGIRVTNQSQSYYNKGTQTKVNPFGLVSINVHL